MSTYPLPAGVEDAILNRTQLARAFAVSENTIDRWVNDGMPVLEHGANGRSYQFQLSACWAWKQERDAEAKRKEAEADAVVEQMRLALIGGEAGETERALPPRERREIYEAEQRYMQAARERRELIPVGEVVDLLESIFSIIRDSVDSLPDRLQRELSLSGAQTEAAIVACDDALDEARRKIADANLSAPRKGAGGGAALALGGAIH